MAQPCAFCNGPGPLTLEHVWPLRFEKFIPKPRGTTAIYRHERGPDGQVETTHHGSTFDYKVRAVCRWCNEGWVAALDDDAESLVIALMRGRSIILDARSQNLLARWTLKVSYMAQYLHPKTRRLVPEQHRHLLYAGGLPPDTYLHVARFRGEPSGWHRLRSFNILTPDNTILGQGYAIGFVLGEFASRLVGYPEATGSRPTSPNEAAAPWVRQLLPRREPFVALPPPNTLRTDTDLHRFVNELPRQQVLF